MSAHVIFNPGKRLRTDGCRHSSFVPRRGRRAKPGVLTPGTPIPPGPPCKGGRIVRFGFILSCLYCPGDRNHDRGNLPRRGRRTKPGALTPGTPHTPGPPCKGDRIRMTETQNYCVMIACRNRWRASWYTLYFRPRIEYHFYSPHRSDQRCTPI